MFLKPIISYIPMAVSAGVIVLPDGYPIDEGGFPYCRSHIVPLIHMTIISFSHRSTPLAVVMYPAR